MRAKHACFAVSALKEDVDGRPAVTEINIGRFFMITPVFDRSGRRNMAEVFVQVACGRVPTIPICERFADIGTDVTYLVREIDSEPVVLTQDDIDARCRTV